MKLNFVAILMSALFFSGCAFAPQSVNISPQIDVPVSKIGSGHEVNLNVIDERPRQTLGTRGVRGIGAELTIQGNLSETVQRAIAEGLANQSIKPLFGSNPEKRELRVEIRNLHYAVTQGFWAGTLRVDTSLKAICIRGALRPYEQHYRGEVVESVQVVQSEEANNSYISQAVSAAVNSLVKDQQLLSCLSN